MGHYRLCCAGALFGTGNLFPLYLLNCCVVRQGHTGGGAHFALRRHTYHHRSAALPAAAAFTHAGRAGDYMPRTHFCTAATWRLYAFICGCATGVYFTAFYAFWLTACVRCIFTTAARGLACTRRTRAMLLPRLRTLRVHVQAVSGGAAAHRMRVPILLRLPPAIYRTGCTCEHCCCWLICAAGFIGYRRTGSVYTTLTIPARLPARSALPTPTQFIASD